MCHLQLVSSSLEKSVIMHLTSWTLIFALFQELVFSASPDATIRIWSVPNTSCVQVVRAHESAVTGLSLHATGDYLLSSSDDQVQSQPGSPEGAAFSSCEEGSSFWGNQIPRVLEMFLLWELTLQVGTEAGSVLKATRPTFSLAFLSYF